MTRGESGTAPARGVIVDRVHDLRPRADDGQAMQHRRRMMREERRLLGREDGGTYEESISVLAVAGAPGRPQGVNSTTDAHQLPIRKECAHGMGGESRREQGFGKNDSLVAGIW